MPPRREDLELLSPAGSFDAFLAAVENGADAVYVGGQHFNARKFAANFTDDELQRAIDHAHVRGVKVYVTLNTLVFDREFADVVAFLRKLHDMGADACIVQDVGVMHAMLELVPDLPMHISTQATVHNSDGIRFLEDLGAERVILARENSAKEMATMTEETGAELEQFVHGAMCYCYSGQCLMSSVIGGRSGNRGACAYTCRLPYDMEEASYQPRVDLEGKPVKGVPVGFNFKPTPGVKEKHVLSARDMNTLERIPELIEAGVVSFKIEGRMKRPEYVAIVTRAYRNAIDRYLAGNFFITPEEKDAVRKIFNREFNEGWVRGKEKWAFTNWDTSGNKGVLIGEVVASGKGWVKVSLTDTLRVKDGVEIIHEPHRWDGQGGGAPEEYGFTVTQMFDERGHYLKEARGGDVVELRGRQWSAPGDPVFKTADVEVLEAARASYEGAPHRRMPVTLLARVHVGEPLAVTARDIKRGVDVTHAHEFVVQPAKKAPLTAERVTEQLLKLGETPFQADEATVDLGDGCFVPIGVLNEARRDALAALEGALAERHHRTPIPDYGQKANAFLTFPDVARDPERVLDLAVNCWTLDHVRAAMRAGARTIYFSGLQVGGLKPKWDEDALAEALDLAAAKGAAVYLASGMVQKDHEVRMLGHAVDRFKGRLAGVLAGHQGALQVAFEAGVPVRTDWQLNVYNSVTVDHLHAKAAARGVPVDAVTVSPELTLDDIRTIAAHTGNRLEAIAHGRLTLMVSEYCSIGHATACQLPGGTWAPCHDKRYDIKDRSGARFPLETDGACRMYILNSVELNMVDRLKDLREAGVDVVRLETIGTDAAAVETQVATYLAAIRDLQEGRAAGRERFEDLAAVCEDGFTTGHFYRGPL